MADYAKFLFDSISGVGDPIVANRQRAAEQQRYSDALGLRSEESAYQRKRDMTGDEWKAKRAAVEDARANQTFALQSRSADRQDAAAERAAEMQGVPTGYRRAAGGGLEPIPGGPAAAGRTANAPAGYRWNANGAELEPIPGGPATAVSGEIAARVGMANSFLTQAPMIRKALERGDATGLWDRMKAGNLGSSDQAGVMRRIQSGSDALQRSLTGAGMPASEAAAYAARYLPTYTDNAASATDKLDQLVRELQSVQNVVTRGKGGSDSMAATVAGTPPAEAAHPGGQSPSAVQSGPLPPVASPAAPAQAAPPGARRAVNPQTGQQLELRNGQWVPVPDA